MESRFKLLMKELMLYASGYSNERNSYFFIHSNLEDWGETVLPEDLLPFSYKTAQSRIINLPCMKSKEMEIYKKGREASKEAFYGVHFKIKLFRHLCLFESPVVLIFGKHNPHDKDRIITPWYSNV